MALLWVAYLQDKHNSSIYYAELPVRIAMYMIKTSKIPHKTKHNNYGITIGLGLQLFYYSTVGLSL